MLTDVMIRPRFRKVDPEDPAHRAAIERVEARMCAPRGRGGPRRQHAPGPVGQRPDHRYDPLAARLQRQRRLLLSLIYDDQPPTQVPPSRRQWLTAQAALLPASACPCLGPGDTGRWHLPRCRREPQR